jgi:hydrogenase expression/formation protein HypC
VPGRVVAVDGLVAEVDFRGVRRAVRLDVVDEPVAPGDYVLNHVGFAIRRIPAAEAAETLALYDRIAALERGDLLREELAAELAATGGGDDDG